MSTVSQEPDTILCAGTDREFLGMTKGRRDGDQDTPRDAREWAGWLCWQLCEPQRTAHEETTHEEQADR